MSRIVSLDPGIRGCGVAVWSAKLLEWAGYIKNPIKTGCDAGAAFAMASAVASCVRAGGRVAAGPVAEIVFEWPRVYQQEFSKGDPNDLLPLVGVGMALCGIYGDATHTSNFPYQWKGQIPKGGAFEARVRDRLSPEELDFADLSGHLAHNVYDAIGIGLHHLGRFERKRVFAR